MAARFLVAVVFGVRFLKVKVGAASARAGVSVSAMIAAKSRVLVLRRLGEMKVEMYRSVKYGDLLIVRMLELMSEVADQFFGCGGGRS